MARKLLALLLLLFATPALAANYSGTVYGQGAVDIPIPASPGKYQVTFQVLSPAEILVQSLQIHRHMDAFSLADGSLLGSDDTEVSDPQFFLLLPDARTITWEVPEAYSVFTPDSRQDFTFSGVRARFEFEQYPDQKALYFIGVAAVPEPAQWALLIGGFGLAGIALRRRRRVGSGLLPAACA